MSLIGGTHTWVKKDHIGETGSFPAFVGVKTHEICSGAGVFLKFHQSPQTFRGNFRSFHSRRGIFGEASAPNIATDLPFNIRPAVRAIKRSAVNDQLKESRGQYLSMRRFTKLIAQHDTANIVPVVYDRITRSRALHENKEKKSHTRYNFFTWRAMHGGKSGECTNARRWVTRARFA